MRFLLTISLALWLANAQAESVRILVQSSPLAGSQYYAVGEQWREMAIRVEWRGHKLGYVPRAENRAVAAAMDQGDKLVARIARLTEHANPWRRVEFEVFVEL
jgi:hypothetical protein